MLRRPLRISARATAGCSLALLLLAGCAGTTGHGTDTGEAASAPPPMPPGEWTSVFENEAETGRGVARRAVWVSTVGDVIDRAVLVFRLEIGRRWEFLPRESCTSPAYFHQVEAPAGEGDEGGEGACWHVRAVNLGTAGDPHPVNRILAGWAQGHDVYLPVVMVGVRFIRWHAGELEQVDYLWNPDLLLPAPTGRPWVPPDWSNEALAVDPAKRTVMRTLQTWGEEWEPKIAATMPF